VEIISKFDYEAVAMWKGWTGREYIYVWDQNSNGDVKDDIRERLQQAVNSGNSYLLIHDHLAEYLNTPRRLYPILPCPGCQETGIFTIGGG